jgi:hypothetical protein
MKKEKKITELFFEKKEYPLISLYMGIYPFLDKAYFYLEKGQKGKIKISFWEKEKSERKEDLKKEVISAIIKSRLKYNISKKNEKTYEYITASVFFTENNKNESFKKEVIESAIEKNFIQTFDEKKKKKK